MLSAYLTEDVFLEGIRQYLKKHAYGNASTSDLWAQLSETSGQDISKFMNLWTKQTGYPVLHAEQNGNKLSITQNRFLASGDTNEDENKQLWWNPLGLLASGQTKASQEILHQKTSEIHLPENSDYFILNYGFNSIFRVQYPSENLKKLGELIAKKEVLSSVDRVALVSDAGYLAQAGYASTTDLLELLLNFQNEEEYVVWREISTQLSSLTSVLFEQPENVKALLKKYRLKLFSEIAHKLGWVPQATDKSSTPMLRALAISNAGKAGDPDIVNEAKLRFERYIEGDKSAIPADLKFTVFQIVLSQGTKEEYNKIKNLYLNTSSTDLKLVTLTALGTTPNHELIQETLQFGLSEHVRSQDLSRVFIYCGSNSNGRRLTWSFAKAHWGLLVENFASSLSSLNHIIKSSISGFTEQSDIDDVKQFFNGKNTKAFNMSLNQSLESVAININWLQRDGEHVIKWLESKFA
jgi:aminopeptidase 2